MLRSDHAEHRRHALSWAWLPAVAILVTAISCTSSDGSGFPFSGPGCRGPYYSNACWSCMQSSCNAGCAVTTCAAYFQCVCACPQTNDETCTAYCAHDEACITCMHNIGGTDANGRCNACAGQCSPTDGG